MKKRIKTDIFRYTDYHFYLEDVCKGTACLDQTDKFYDMLMREDSFIGRDFLDDIINGKETAVSVSQCMHISKALAHTNDEAEYFRCLVAISQSDNERETWFFNEMRKNLADRNSGKTDLIDKGRDEFYAQWYHSVVRALIGTVNDAGTIYQQLEKKMVLSVPEHQIQESVELLARLGFIKKNMNGEYQIATEKNIKTGLEFSWEEKKQIHLHYLKLAGDILSENNMEPKKVSSHVIGISGKTFEMICNYTDEFKKKINALVENEDTTEQVYLYQLIFVPLTKDSSND